MEANQANLARGQALTVKMFEKLKERRANGDRCSIEQRWHRGNPQGNINLPFIEKLGQHPELAEGFASILTDYLTLNDGPFIEAGYYRMPKRGVGLVSTPSSRR